MPQKGDIVAALIGGIGAVIYNMFLAAYVPIPAPINTVVLGFVAAYIAFYAKAKGWGR